MRQLLKQHTSQSDHSLIMHYVLTYLLVDYYYYYYLLLPRSLGRGSRCEEDNNAFWSAAAALLPADLIEKRQARAAGRILGLNYQQVTLAVALLPCALPHAVHQPAHSNLGKP